MSALAGVATVLPDLVAQSGSLTERALVGIARVVGFSLVAAGVAAAVAAVYRWYVRERVPGGLPALFGLSAVVPLLGATNLLQGVMDPNVGPDPIDEAKMLANVATVLVALAATRVGTSVGDRLGSDVAVATGERAVEAEVGRVVQAVGRVITVELPDEVEDIVGYDPVPAETKENLAGKTFVFPRRLTVDELRDRLVTRLKADYAVGHVDLELADDGSVEYLAVGSRAAGIGPTLPPETSAVAVRADPAFAASAGDLVQVWRTDPFERVLTAEVRGMVDDVVTLAVDAADTRKLDAEERYKLVTLPVETRPDREFASVLRAAEETMAAVTVAEGSDLAGQPVGALDVTIVAIRPAEGPVEPLPARDRRLTAGDALYLVATPEAIRKVELGARPPAEGIAGEEPAGPSAAAGADLPPEERVDATTPVAGESREDPGPAAAESRASDPSGELGPDDRAATADNLSEVDAPGIETLEADADGDESADAPSAEAVPEIEALEADTDGEADDGGVSGEGTETEPDADESSADEPSGDEPTGDGPPPEEPTREDLVDLPGTDVNELTGADVDAEPTAENGDGALEIDEESDRDTGAADDTDDESSGGDAVDADGDDDAVDSDATGDNGDGGDDDDGDGDDSDSEDGWSVAVDQRKDADDS